MIKSIESLAVVEIVSTYIAIPSEFQLKSAMKRILSKNQSHLTSFPAWLLAFNLMFDWNRNFSEIDQYYCGQDGPI